MVTVSALRALVSVAAFEEAVGEPLTSFSHDCHGASLSLVKSGLLGPQARVARGSCHGVFGQHSWVTVGDPYDPGVAIVDATLWSYDESVVGIWVGRASDNGKHHPKGEGSIWDWGRPPEALDDSIDLTPTTPLSRQAKQFLDILGPLDQYGWAVLSSAPVQGWPAAEIIAAMDDTPTLKALIPIDILGMLTDRNPGGLYLATD